MHDGGTPASSSSAGPTDTRLGFFPSAATDSVQGLLQKTPSEVADWALTQVSDLQDGSKSLETMPVFDVARQIRFASRVEKETLVRNFITGVGSLPPQKKAEVIRLVMHNVNSAQDAGANGSRAPPLIRNVMRLAEEAKIQEMPQEELQGIVQEAQTAAAKAVKPDELLGVVRDLPAQEREQLTEALVDAHIVPEEQRETVQQAVRPGGHIDRLASALRVLDTVCGLRWCFIFALPGLELVLAGALGFCECGLPLVRWLRVDTLLTLLVALCVAYISRTMAPAYEKLRSDPLNSASRWQEVSRQSRSWRVRLDEALPGVGLESFQSAGTALLLGLFFQALGGLWALVGLLQISAAGVVSCSGLVLASCSAFATGRLLLVFAGGCGIMALLAGAEAEELEEAPPELLRPLAPKRREVARPKEAASSAPARRVPKQGLPSKGKELHKEMASDHADLMERLAKFENRGRQ